MHITKKRLILFNALIWLFASAMLLKHAYQWSQLLNPTQLFLSMILGILLAGIKSRLIFTPLTKRNIFRIDDLEESKVTLLNFHNRRDKIIIIVMSTLGVTIRSIPAISIQILMPIYLGIGIAMGITSMQYLISFFKR